jgi:hypothetical protein
MNINKTIMPTDRILGSCLSPTRKKGERLNIEKIEAVLVTLR